MTQRDELPVAGKSYGLGMSMSVAAHILLLLTLIALGVYSTQRIMEMAEVKKEELEKEKEGKLEVAVAEQELQQDLQEILEDLNPEADADEIKQLLEELEEKMDVDALVDQLTAAMDEDNGDQQQEDAEDAYAAALEAELQKHLEDAEQATDDERLKQELLADIVYKDLPEIDNNIENALKRDGPEGVIKKALAEKTEDLIAELKSQIARESRESTWQRAKDVERNKQRTELRKQLEIANSGASSEDQVMTASEKVQKMAKDILAAAEKRDPYSDENRKEAADTRQKKMKDAQDAYESAKKDAQKARAEFHKEVAVTQNKLNQTVDKHTQEEGSKKNAAEEKKLQAAKTKMGAIEKKIQASVEKDKQNPLAKTIDTYRKVTAEFQVARRAVYQHKDSVKELEKSLKDLDQSRKKEAVAQQEEAHALKKLQSQARAAFSATLRATAHSLKKLSKEEAVTLKTDVDALNAVYAEQKAKKFSSKAESIEEYKKSIAVMEKSGEKFAKKANELRSKAIAKTEKSLQELKTLANDIKELGTITDLDSLVKVVRDESLRMVIEDRAEEYRERMKSGTDAEKDQEQREFKLDAKSAIDAAGDGSEDSDGESGDDQEKKATVSLVLSAALKNALAKGMGMGQSGQSEPKQIKSKSGGSGASGGVEAPDNGRIIALIKKHKRNRRLTMEEKQAILAKNKVTNAPKEPPVLRFAKPTLRARTTHDEAVSEHIYVGNLGRREVATLDPNRARKSHPQFKDKDFSAVAFCTRVPILDGDASDWDLNKTRLSPGKNVFMQWRPDGLYVLAQVRDKSGQFEHASAAAMNNEFWNFDCIEMWFDMKNSKAESTDQQACQQFWVAPELPGVGRENQMWEIIWGKSGRTERRDGAGKRYLGSRVDADKKGYTIEYFIPRALLTNLKFFRAGQVIGFLYAINHNGNQNIISSSLSHYNPSFHYSSAPSSWGNLQLLGTDAALNTLTANGSAAEYPTVEISKSLGLMVNDPDSNTDIGAINSVTVRVRNRYGFDGEKTNAAGALLGDWEDVSLLETGKNTGVFKGWVPTTLLPSITGDAQLGVQPGDIIDVSYNDYVRMAGEYDKKMNVEVLVVSPIFNLGGANKVAAVP